MRVLHIQIIRFSWLGVLERLRFRLTDFDKISIRILHVAAKFIFVILRLGQELGTLALPLLVKMLNVGDTDIQKATDFG